MKNNKFFALWQNSDLLSVNKEIIRLFDCTSAVLLSIIIEEMQKQKENDLVLPTIQDMKADITLSRFDQYHALEKLKEKGIIEIKLEGFPSRRHVKLNTAILTKLLSNEEKK